MKPSLATHVAQVLKAAVSGAAGQTIAARVASQVKA